MADAIEQQFNTKAELIKGSGGIFDVKADNQLIYSKKETGRFPENQEIFEILKSHSA